MGVGDRRVRSATGKVVSRKSPRELVDNRRVSAKNRDGDEMSRTPAKSAGDPEMKCEATCRVCAHSQAQLILAPFRKPRVGPMAYSQTTS